MTHSTSRSTVSWTPDFHRAKQTACCRKPFRRFVRLRGKLSKQFRPWGLTSSLLKQGVKENLRRRALVLLCVCFSLHSLLAQSTNATPIATLAELQTRINEHLGQTRFASALW